MNPAKDRDLHGNVPNSARTVLVLVDVLNDLEFEGGEALLRSALPMAQRLRDFKRKIKPLGVPVIYANDNFGKWQSDIRSVVAHCLEDDVRGAPIVRLLQPDDDDYCVLKPKHSAFYGSPLDILLTYLQAQILILGGLTSDNCVLFTAMDAYLRDFKLHVPADGSAATDEERHGRALDHMRALLKANTTPLAELKLEENGRLTESR
ncbi:cysteine hydrolase [bacterium]|nr:cysteine hydrolase [bacterium]